MSGRGVPETEVGWQGTIVNLARLRGWTAFHWPDSRRATAAGWPDLVLLRPPEIIFVEVKRERGRLSVVQAEVIAHLRDAGCEAHVWRPSDWEAVRARLMAPRRSPGDLRSDCDLSGSGGGSAPTPPADRSESER